MRISLSLEEIKNIIAEKFDVDPKTVDVYNGKKLFIKNIDGQEYEPKDNHNILEFEKQIQPLKKEEQSKNRWGKL